MIDFKLANRTALRSATPQALTPPAPAPVNPLLEPKKQTPLSFADWAKGPGAKYGFSAAGGEAYTNYISDLNKQYDTAYKNYDKAKLGSDYETAISALQPAATADVGEFQRIAPMAQRRLVGSLNSRGLGASLAAGGAGSGAYSELLNRQASGLHDIQSGYEGLQNNLNLQKTAGNIDLDSFYRNLMSQRNRVQNIKQQQTLGPLDVLGFGASAGSLFV